MNETLQFLERHGYWLLAGAILARQACLPIPANLFLVAAGALAHAGKLSLSGTIGLSVITFLVADLGWYEAGRRFGDRILHFVCGLSGDPTSCVNRATGAFTRHRVRTLLLSKFVVGLDAVSAPLAGAGGVSPILFLVLDASGAALWSSSYLALGYIFSNQLDLVATHVARMGAFVALIIVAGFTVYIVRRLARWKHFVHQFKLARITPEQLNEKLAAGEDILLVDLQGRPKHKTELMAIPGAVRINPRRLEQCRDIEIPPSQEIVLYCECPGEFTSARVALALRQRGIEHVRPLAGGLKAWRDHGFPVTSKVRNPASAAV
ncbi:MAG TPA: rhodanese-like domain-containing protein [Bryobacteraceae bacterium]|nr:rhodanese-like domain-containing protein [Bryobacteraceae bacterium]